MPRYLLDTNIFIEAKNHYYGFDFCPAFWEWLIMQNKVGKVSSIEEVNEELHGRVDALSKWADLQGPEFFRPTGKEEKVMEDMAERISDWTKGNYTKEGYEVFFESTDYWLVAHALAHDFTIVTRERLIKSPVQIQIPNVCDALGVPNVDPFEMLRCEGVRFVLDDATRRSG